MVSNLNSNKTPKYLKSKLLEDSRILLSLVAK